MFKLSNMQTQFKAFEEWQTSVSVVGKEEVKSTSTATATSTSTAAKPVKPVVAEAKPEVRISNPNILKSYLKVPHNL
jgi:hypothetical protein